MKTLSVQLLDYIKEIKMRITLDNYQIMDAIQEYLNKKDLNFDFDNTYTEVYAKVTEDIRQHKKHKNGKVVKCKHGYPEWEVVGQETKSLHLNETTELEIFVEC
tara:strand:- start:5579 stop:5890 length:312 start_codon:yes stop_codon:yes gene_type:complete